MNGWILLGLWTAAVFGLGIAVGFWLMEPRPRY